MAAASKPLVLVPNLIQGVSQQAIQNRRDAQCEAQRNCINSVLEGVVARPHATLLKLYAGYVLTGAHFGETSHGASENYLTAVNSAGTGISAFDLTDGTECTVTSTAPDFSYLSSGPDTARDKIRTQVVDDTSFLTNREVSPAMAATVSPAVVNEALIFVKATAFNAAYKISIAGPGGSVGVTESTSGTSVEATSAIAIALNAGINGVSGYSTQILGSTIRVFRADGQDFIISGSDGNGDTYLLVFKGTCKSFADLPARAFNGMVLKVQGDPQTQADDFYVKFVGDYSTGQWEEIVGPATPTTINAATMPHTLVCTNYRTFEFRRPAWSTRIAGDASSAKDPGFIGKSIRDMIYHQRRLGIIWQAGAVFSKSNFPFTFFADTMQTVLATAPVDTKVSSGDKRGSAILDFALQAQENLYLFAQRVQFRVSSGQDPFKQDTVEVLPSMSYQYAPNAYPLTLGSFVFLSSDNGPYASLRALQFSQTKLSGDVDVTSHVGQYMAAGIREMTASETLRYVFLQTDGDTDVLYLFNYTYDGDNGFIQTGINTWDFPGGQILWVGLKDNILRIFQQRAEGVAYLQVDLTPQAVDPIAGSTYQTRLDYRRDETGVTGLAYNATANTSSFTLPYIPTGSMDVRVVTRADKAGGYTRGRVFPLVSVVGAVVTVTGDLTGYQFYVGQRIVAYRDESEFCVRSDKGALPVDRLGVNRFYLTLASTGYTRIEITATNKPLRQYEFTGRVLGGAGGETGPPTPQNGLLQAPVNEEAKDVSIRLINDSFLPSYWQSAAYDYTAVGWGGVT